MACTACMPIPPPVAISSPPTHAEPTASNLPWPYGWSASAGRRANRSVASETPSLSRSLSECAPSAINAGELAATPTTPLRPASPTFATAPTLVILSARSSASSSSFDAACLEAAPVCLRIATWCRGISNGSARRFLRAAVLKAAAVRILQAGS
eukprot:6922753-Prymnesium_polylepis.1